MFGMTSFQEFVVLLIIIAILSGTGVWPRVMRGLREMRGEPVAEERGGVASRDDLDLSFRLLGLSPSATWEEIERAYRAKAKIHHPDRGGDGDAMRALNEAYQLLKRSRRR